MRRLLVPAVLAVASVAMSANAAQAQWSPNGFPAPWCTWWCDGRTNSWGWRLSFRDLSNANAKDWPGNVRNATIRQWPCSWSNWNATILVFPAQTGIDSRGHVACIEQAWFWSSGACRYFTVSHTKWATSQPIRYCYGYPVYQATFEVIGPGVVRRVDTGQVFSVVYLTRS
jgi:hypothetical protein